MEGHFIRKPVDLDEVVAETARFKRYGYEPEPIKVVGRVTLSDAEFKAFQSDLISDYDFFKPLTNKCGIVNGIRKCIIVSNKSKTVKLAVESEGYNYARYVAIIEIK